jgi:hypothetical protein
VPEVLPAVPEVLPVVSVVLPVVEPGVVVAPGVLLAAAPELMSVLLPGVVVVPEAPMEVPLPVVPLVDGVVPIEPLAVLLVVSLGDVVVEGVVLEVDEEEEVSLAAVPASSFLPHALSDRAAIRARAAHCAIGDLIIRNSLRLLRCASGKATAGPAACGSL